MFVMIFCKSCFCLKWVVLILIVCKSVMEWCWNLLSVWFLIFCVVYVLVCFCICCLKRWIFSNWYIVNLILKLFLNWWKVSRLKVSGCWCCNSWLILYWVCYWMVKCYVYNRLWLFSVWLSWSFYCWLKCWMC